MNNIKSKIKILQINLNNCRAAQDLQMQKEKEGNIDITLISEPYRVPDSADWAASLDGTAAIHWSTKNMQCSGVLQKRGRFSVMMKWGTLIAVSCYISPNVSDEVFEEFLDELDNSLSDAEIGQEIILGGDFNAKSLLWGSSHTNSRGDRLSRWCASRDLILLNTGTQPTCVRHQGTSLVDITWCNSKIKPHITDWKVLSEETLSDHCYIAYSVHRTGSIHKKKKYAKWAYKKFNEDLFRESLEWTCNQQDDAELDVKKAARWLQDVLTMACDYAMPRAKQTHHPNAYWWNTQIAELRGKCVQARKKWQKAKRDDASINEILNREDIYRDINPQRPHGCKSGRPKISNASLS